VGAGRHPSGVEQTGEVRVERSTMTVDEAAEVLGISRTSAYECVRRGELRAIRLGRRLVVPRLVVDQLLAGDRPTIAPISVES
jgi:excisionase family DNA binding protein